MKRCCDKTEKYFIEFRKRDDNELIWLVCEEHFQKEEFRKRVYFHRIGIQKRFPILPKDIINSSWSGVVCRSGNSSQIFEKLDDNIFVAGCYNGSGIGVGTLFGEQIAILSEGESSKEISIIQKKKNPNWLPPQPFLNMGIFTRLLFEKIVAKSEI